MSKKKSKGEYLLNDLNLFRLEVSLAAIFIVFFALFFSYFTPLHFNLNVTLVFSFLVLVQFCLTFFKNIRLKSIRKGTLYIYLVGTTYAVFIVHENNYSLVSFFFFVIIYLLTILYLNGVKSFLILKAVILTALSISLISLNFKTEIDFFSLLISFLFLTLIGCSVALYRQFAKNKIKRRESLLDLIFNNSRMGLILIGTSDFKVNEINKKALTLLGFESEEDLKGIKLKELKFRNRSIFSEVENKKNTTLEFDDDKIVTIKKIEFKANGSNQYLFEFNIYSHSTDYDRVNEYERLKITSEENYENLFKNSSSYLCIINKEGIMIDVNETICRSLGYKRSEIIGKKYNHYDEKNYDDERAIINEKVWNGEEQLLRKNVINKEGKIIPLEVLLIKGKYLGEDVIISNSRDISERLKYQRLVEKSQRKYKDLIDSSIIGIIIQREDITLFINKKAIHILEFNSKEEGIGKNSINFADPQESSDYIESLSKIKNGTDAPLNEYTLKSSKGNLITVELKPKLIDFEGKRAILISFFDVNDRKKVEFAEQKVLETKYINKNLKLQLAQNRQIQQKLQNAQSYSEGIIESSLDMIFTTDINGRINKLNSSAKKKLKLSDEDYFMKPFNIFLKDKKEGGAILEKLSLDKSFSGEIEMIKSNGNTFTAFISISYLYNTENTFLGIMGVSRDISEINKKKQEIKEQAAKLNTIIESSSHYFFTVNKKMEITSFNRLYKNDIETNYGAIIKKGRSFFSQFERLSEVDRKEHEYFWNKNLTLCFRGETVEFEMEEFSISGETYYREVFLNPIYSESGKVEEVSGIGHDTTDKRLYEKELKKSLKEKEVLLQEVHHRVKNNMQIISSLLNLQSSYVKDEKVLQTLSESQDRIRAMAAIHERLYRSKNFSDINFSMYIENLAQNLINTYEQAEAVIELNCQVDEIFLTLDDSIPCGLIVNELISNALKYAFKGRSEGVITFLLKKKNSEVIMEVSDNGIGLPKSIEIDKADTLGLQLVKSLVNQIEGKLKIERVKGTKFIVTFKPKE